MTVNRVSANKSFIIPCLDKSLYTFLDMLVFRFDKQSNENTERKIDSFSTNFSFRVKLYQHAPTDVTFSPLCSYLRLVVFALPRVKTRTLKACSSKISQPLCHNHNQECIEGHFILSCHSFTKG